MPPATDPNAATLMAVAQQQESSFTRSMRNFVEIMEYSELNDSTMEPQAPINEPADGPKVIIHLIRHAEADHNLAHLHGLDRATYPDPVLTARGFSQCQKVLSTFPHMDDITLILSSPLRRTMQTALFSFQPIYARGVRLMLWPALREWGNGASNIGYPVKEMEKEMADLPVDLRLLNEGWELEKDVVGHGAERSNRVRRELYALGETLKSGGEWNGVSFEKHEGTIHVIVVSHGGFLGNVMKTQGHLCLRNGEFKSFAFASAEQIGRGASKHRLFELPRP